MIKVTTACIYAFVSSTQELWIRQLAACASLERILQHKVTLDDILTYF